MLISHLSGSYNIFERMYGETKYVICVLSVEPLYVFISIVHDSDSSHVINNLPSVNVEQIVTTIVSPITGKTSERMYR